MKTELKWRFAIVLGVALLSIGLTLSTAMYFLGVSGKISMSPEKIEALRLKSIPLGLDLQGGVDVLLAIDEAKTREAKIEKVAENIRRALSSESPAIDATVDIDKSAEPGIVIMLNKADQERSLMNVLERYQTQFTGIGEIRAGTAKKLTISNVELHREMKDSIDSALKVIRDRVDNLGVTQPSVTKQGDSRIRVQIPGERDPERVISTIIRPAQLEFRGLKTSDSPNAAGDYMEETALYIDPTTGEPLEGRTIPPGYEVLKSKASQVNKATGKKESVERYLLVKKKVEMRGDSVQDAWVAMNPASFESPVEVRLTFKPDGAKKFGDITQDYLKKPLAVILDNVVYTYPRIQTVIDGGSCQITGDFTVEEAQDIAMVLKAGALPAALEPIQKQTVEATLGADSIAASVKALSLGALFVGLVMIIYYGTAGAIAIIALLINAFIILAFMKLASATLTLSGIGGILLTIGMAVDANVLIYERIREELFAKKPLKQAISLGYDRAFGVICDGNLTTLISGLTLLQFGTGSVKGFALALNVGIIATLFTGLFCTHTLVDTWFAWFKKLSVGRLTWVKPGFHFDFIKLRYVSYVITGLLMLVSLYIILPTNIGINWGSDFTGGIITSVTTQETLTTQEVAGDFKNWRVQKVTGENSFLVRSKLVNVAQGENAIVATQDLVKQQLEETVGAGQFTITGNDAVSNEVGKEFKGMAIFATLLCCIGILIYMAFRFVFLFGLAAVLALVHDLVGTIGLFSLFGYFGWAGDMTLDVVSALLVLLGSSVNDTIVIFDRMRENSKLYPTMNLYDNANRSICESINRTIMTAGTTMAALLAMVIWGGAGLYDFALVMTIGLVLGTYSSSFVAAPLLCDISRYVDKRRKAKRNPVKQIAPLLNK